jgi:RNA ligase
LEIKLSSGEIASIQDIQTLLVSGETNWSQYGDVEARTRDNLTLFTYNRDATVNNRWNFFERVSRGLVINRLTGEIVARPFDKFFNWLEDGRVSEERIASVTDKVDGSLGILYRNNGEYKITTRGSLHSDQGVVATEMLKAYDLSDPPEEITLLFEIIHPQYQIIVDYGTVTQLLLIGVRNRFTGEQFPFFPDVYNLSHQFGFATPNVYPFNDLSEIIASCGELGINREGYVVEFSDGSRFKFKGERYLELHRLIEKMSFKNVLRQYQEIGEDQTQAKYGLLPAVYKNEVKSWLAEIRTAVEQFEHDLQTAWREGSLIQDQRDYAAWVKTQRKDLQVFLFSLRSDKPYRDGIFRLIYEYLKDIPR